MHTFLTSIRTRIVCFNSRDSLKWEIRDISYGRISLLSAQMLRLTFITPEAIESIFILYRITGDESLRDEAWRMFQAIEEHTKTKYGNAALDDITQIPPPKSDSMD